MAYADFLTALMAFFLLMWLVSGVSPDARAAIAAEFKTKHLDLVDTAGRPLFESASGSLTEEGAALVTAAANMLAPLSNRLSIEGHTDAFSLTGVGYSNWELSSDRANEARRLLETGGVAPARFTAVMGLSDTKPLDPGQPHLAQNRRISLKVHLDAAP